MSKRPDSPTVLVVEDDPQLLAELRMALEDSGHRVVEADNVDAALSVAKTEAPSLVVVDMQLPSGDGLEICRGIRWSGSNVPIIAVSPNPTEADVVVALEVGADDFVGPIRLPELLARARARMRSWRRQESAVRREAESELTTESSFGNLIVDHRRRSVTHKGVRVDLSPTLFEILALLIKRRGEAVTRETIREEVWPGSASQTTRTIDNYILKLRQKLEQDPGEPSLIISVYGKGYKFAA